MRSRQPIQWRTLWPTIGLSAVCSRSNHRGGTRTESRFLQLFRLRTALAETRGCGPVAILRCSRPNSTSAATFTIQPPMLHRRATSASDPQPLIETLPVELLERIILFTPARDIIRLSSVRYQSSSKSTNSPNVDVPEGQSRFP